MPALEEGEQLVWDSLATYGLALGAGAAAYAARLLERPWMRAWYQAGLAEPWRDAAHEDECRTFGTVVADSRTG